MAVLHLMVGIQGSGKSTFSKSLSKKLNCKIISSDEVRKMYPNLEEKIFTMKEYVGYNKEDLDIADPWGLSTKVYENCAKEIDDCIERIINKI